MEWNFNRQIDFKLGRYMMRKQIVIDENMPKSPQHKLSTRHREDPLKSILKDCNKQLKDWLIEINCTVD